jgi:uncharacterized protein involved in exopolysaccharide biosynthesis/Mrp family chromosome partitioning ATPase
MNQTTNSPAPTGLDFGDILFIVFRHKWKILGISTLGILGAAVLYLFWPVPYQSEAKLLIKYVVDTKAPVQGTANDHQIGMVSERAGEDVINTEVEILTSLDLIQQAAEALPGDVLLKLGTGTNLAMAAAVIRSGLRPEVGKQSDVIRAIFKHKDPGVVQPVLRQLIETYRIRQTEIHRALGLYDDLAKERDQLKSRLAVTEDELRKAKRGAGILSVVEDSKQSYGDALAKLEQQRMDTEAELAERQGEVSAMTNLFPAAASPGAGSLVASNLSAGAQVASGPTGRSGTNLAAAAYAAPVPSATVDQYKRVGSRLDSLNKREQELLLYLTPETSLVKDVRAQIAASEKERKKLEDENPGLLAAKTLDPGFLGSGSDHTAASSGQMGLMAEMAKVRALESRLREYSNQVEIIRRKADLVSDAEGRITELERQRHSEEEQYSYFQKNLEELRVDEQLGASRNSNIIPIQTASPPFRDAAKLRKAALMLLFGSIAGAFTLAFVLEFYLDPSVKRPLEIETRLHLPLFLSIPRLRLNGKAGRHSLEAARTPLLAETNEAGDRSRQPEVTSRSPALGTPRSPAPWDPRHRLRPFHDALRDRLITYFDLKNLTRKPKLVALTSCGEGSGVTTLAAGLAASLSETGEGNVLLVDMNSQGLAHHFYRGNPACGLEDALELERRDTALVQEKLYVVTENQNGGKLPRSLPKHFQHLVPKLKASDYDYIIFDMPPISQISVTSKLARYMDIALVVVEAEETDRDLVKRASSFLAQSGANVGVVLNKTRAYGPKRLQQGL